MTRGPINRSTSDWKILIAEYESRSVSCGYFCKLHEVSRGQLYKWRGYFLSHKTSVEEESAFIPLVINKEEKSDQKNLTSHLRLRSVVVLEWWWNLLLVVDILSLKRLWRY